MLLHSPFNAHLNPILCFAGYGTSVIGNKTIEWMKAVVGKGRPFAIYFAPHAPHSPSTPSEWYEDRRMLILSMNVFVWLDKFATL